MKMYLAIAECPACGALAPELSMDECDKIATSLANEIVQSLADSEPTPKALAGQDALENTEAADCFVVEGDELVKVIECGISNAFYDCTLPARRAPPPTDALDEIAKLVEFYALQCNAGFSESSAEKHVRRYGASCDAQEVSRQIWEVFCGGKVSS